MIRLTVFAALTVVCLGAVPRQYRPILDGRIVGGTPTIIENHPYQVSMEVNFSFYQGHWCGGSIISREWVLLAAHCVEDASNDEVKIRVGTSIVRRGGSLHSVSEMISHPKYGNHDYDIALIKVVEPFKYSDSVQAISMATRRPPTGSAVVVTGWGDLSSGGPSPTQLQQVEVDVVDSNKCNRAYGNITPRMICAGVPEGGKDSCQGDSGGPLVYEGELSGIVSFGYGCAVKGYPGVYADVAALRSWVTSMTGVN